MHLLLTDFSTTVSGLSVGKIRKLTSVLRFRKEVYSNERSSSGVIHLTLLIRRQNFQLPTWTCSTLGIWKLSLFTHNGDWQWLQPLSHYKHVWECMNATKWLSIPLSISSVYTSQSCVDMKYFLCKLTTINHILYDWLLMGKHKC